MKQSCQLNKWLDILWTNLDILFLLGCFRESFFCVFLHNFQGILHKKQYCGEKGNDLRIVALFKYHFTLRNDSGLY